MADVFISYSREDRHIAERLAAALEAEGFSFWMDSHLAGGSTYTEVTEEELDKARKVIVLWSERSIKSGWVKDEAQAGRDQGKLLPVSIDGSIPPMGFRQLQTVDCSQWAAGIDKAIPRAIFSGLDLSAAERSEETAKVSATPLRRRFHPLPAIVLALALLGLAIWQFAPFGSGGEGPAASVTVMPLQSIGDEPDEEALANGITEELIDRLRRIDGLVVASGATGGTADGNVLNGSVRRQGDAIRVSARLEDGDGIVLWSQSFDRQLNDLLSVQQEIASAVANTLSVSLNLGRESRDFGGTDNPEAYANYLQARSYRYHPDRQRTIAFAERAVALDPDYIKAWSEANTAYGITLYSRLTKNELDDLLNKMDHASARALELDPAIAIGQVARAWYLIARGDLIGAAERYEAIEDLDKGNDAELKLSRALYENQIGRYSKSAELRQSMELIDPIFSIRNDDMGDHFVRSEFDEVLQSYEDLASQTGQAGADPAIYAYWSARLSGQDRKAREIAKGNGLGPLYENVGQFSFDPVEMPDLPAPELKQWADRTLGAGGRRELVRLSFFASQSGRQDVALRYLRLAFDRPGFGAYYYLWQPPLSDLRKTAGFKRLVEELGLVEIWRESGDWGDFCRPVSETDFECV